MWQVLTIVILLVLMGGLSFIPGPKQPVNIVAGTGFVLLAAFTMGELFKRIRLPALLGYIAAGIVFGPSVANLALGPAADFQLLPANITDTAQLAYIEILTVGVIGTLGGGELKIADLREQIGSIFAVVGLFFVAIVPLTAGVVWLLATYLPQLAPFLGELSSPELLGAAVLFGVFGFAMSPAATLAIIQETRSQGRFTSLVLGVVIVADLVLVASFLLAHSFTEILARTGTLGLDPVLAALPTIGAEFMWALVIGAVTGLVFILYFRFVAQEMLLFTVGTIFVASYACDQLHAERLLAFLTAGFIVQNLSRHGHDMIEALERISLPVFVVYFALMAADLELGAISQYIWLTLILTGVRTGALYGSVKIATRIGDWSLSEFDRRYLWFSFLSRGGVDLVLASLLAKETGLLGPWVLDFQAVIMAIVVVHLAVGPALLKYAFDRVGETKEARNRDEGDEELIDDSPATEQRDEFLEDPLPTADFENTQLQERITHLQENLTRVFRSAFVGPVRRHEEALDQINDGIETTIQSAVDDLRSALEQLEEEEGEIEPDRLVEAAEEIRSRHESYRRQLGPQIDLVQQIDDAPLRPETIDDVLEQIRSMEEFDRYVRVAWDERLWTFQDEDRLPTRLLKLVRRLRQATLGPGKRTVPVGRLWRFYVELSLPEYLAGAVETTSEKNEAYWFELGEHLREIDALFETIVHILAKAAHRQSSSQGGPTQKQRESTERSELPSVVSIPMGVSSTKLPYFAELDIPEKLRESYEQTRAAEVAETELPESLEQAIEEPVSYGLDRLDEFHEAFEERAAFLDQTQRVFRTKLLNRLGVAFRNTFKTFLEGVERAGTLQLPGFRYRPSLRFDRARRAERRLDEQLEREAEVVGGYQGWIIVDQQLALFFHWFDDYLQRAEGVLDDYIQQTSLQQLRNFGSRCRERPEQWQPPGDTEEDDADVPDASIDWERWLAQQIQPSLQRTLQACGQARRKLGQGAATQNLLEVLERRIERFPEAVSLLSKFRTERVGSSEQVEQRRVALRRWYMLEMIRETALRFVEFNEHAERSLRRSLAWLEDVREILEFNLSTGQQKLRETGDEQATLNEMAGGGLERAAERVEEISEALARDDRELRNWIRQELRRIVREASEPFLKNRLDDIPQELDRRSIEVGQPERPSLLRRMTGPVRRGYRQFRDWAKPLYREVRDDLKRALTESTPTVTRTQVRERLVSDEQVAYGSIPVIYRRLFTPVPMDIPDFYVPRTDLENACIQAITRWLRGRRTSLLVYGDRGMGKRTLLRHLRPSRFADQAADVDAEDITRVQFGARITSEEQLCANLQSLVDGTRSRELRGLAGQLHDRAGREIVVIEDPHSIFTRTEDGVERMRTFLDFMSETSDRVLWILLMRKPTATFLETTTDLFDYFTHTFEIPPLETDEIESMIKARHRVSGFHLEFQSLETRLLDQLRHPIAASEASRHPRRAFFDRLHRLSRGNPMLALMYWLESVEIDPDDDTQFYVEPLPKEEIDLTRPLSLQQKLILASLTRHGYISVHHLADVFQEEEPDIRTELEHLERLGFVETTPGRDETFRMQSFPEALVTEKLREDNFV